MNQTYENSIDRWTNKQRDTKFELSNCESSGLKKWQSQKAKKQQFS